MSRSYAYGERGLRCVGVALLALAVMLAPMLSYAGRSATRMRAPTAKQRRSSVRGPALHRRALPTSSRSGARVAPKLLRLPRLAKPAPDGSRVGRAAEKQRDHRAVMKASAQMRRAAKRDESSARRVVKKQQARSARARKQAREHARLRRSLRSQSHRRAAARRARLRLSDRQAENMGSMGVVGLLAQGAAPVYRFARLGRSAGTVVGVVAPVLVGVASSVGLYRAKTMADRVDAVHGLLWAAQAGAWTLRQTVGWKTGTFVTASGLAGGGLQVGVGVYRMVKAWKARDWGKVVSGALDITAGAAWALTAVNVALPITMGVFIGATIAKLASGVTILHPNHSIPRRF